MKHFYLSVHARSPLAIRADHAEGGARTSQHIPGATLRGSLAAAHRLLRPEQQDEFISLFNEEVFFPHLYPALFNKSKSGIHNSDLPVVPLPKTAQSCKRFPGFTPLPSEDSDEQRHGIRDSLLDWAAFSLLDEEQQSISALLAPLSQHPSCKQCEQVMDHVNGHYRYGRSDPKQKMRATVHTRLQTRTGINRDWGVVEEGILYNREVFDEDMLFWGEVLLPDKLATTFEEFVIEADEEDIIRMGTGRTRGLGRVNIVISDAKARDITSFKNKLNSFDAAVKRQAQAAGVKVLAPFYIALTLHSASILCDSFLRYRRTLDTVTLGELLDYASTTFKSVYQSTGVQRINGWNELWGTPRTNDYALEIGSTFLFACTQKPEEKLIQALYTLEEVGIGRRRSEGFGRISISDPFHLEGEQV